MSKVKSGLWRDSAGSERIVIADLSCRDGAVLTISRNLGELWWAPAKEVEGWQYLRPAVIGDPTELKREHLPAPWKRIVDYANCRADLSRAELEKAWKLLKIHSVDKDGIHCWEFGHVTVMTREGKEASLRLNGAHWVAMAGGKPLDGPFAYRKGAEYRCRV